MLTDEQTELIRAQVLSRGKIAGIKLYREYTGASLVESKQQIEKLLGNGRLETANNPNQDNLDLDDALMDSILNAIQEGNKLRAVKIYKDATGTSLRTAKEFIEKLMHELEMVDPESVGKTGCLILLIALVASIGLLF